ncbi:hypothetical protein [Raoultella ornithinolytica]|uniref:hypothetical protein n=1 Tax=Raoultella ornithinolytica TaxID=54291 RepID=UPI000E57BEF0|nr:hypothetical protein [Raoultella ornithinolytica]HCI9483977.1 hypothetical protein [Raoultella ornithinolytica]
MNLTLYATSYSVLFKAVMTAGLRFLSIAFRVLLLRPAAGIVLMMAGLLIAHSTQSNGVNLQGTLVELINQLQAIPAEKLANKITSILLSWWLSLTLLSVALEAICQFTAAPATRFASTYYRSASGSSCVIIEGRSYPLPKGGGSHE